MFTPWNSFSACLLARSDRIGGDRLDLLNRGHVIPLGREVHRESGGFTPPAQLNVFDFLFNRGGMPAPRNLGSACLLAKSDRIGRARLDLVNQGHVIPLGLSCSKKAFSQKLHQRSVSGAFLRLFW